MKKNLLALSVAAALGAGASVALADDLETGAALVVPYYTVQNGNATLINIVNTDTTRGKALKVRFRGAQNSDDVFDFQLFLSPADMWTANISQGADGRATLSTSDNSCTLPADVNQAFVTNRLNGAGAAGTREGYVEIINMGDIINDGNSLQNALYTATKHVNGVAPCTSNVLQSIVSGSTAQLNVDSTYGMGAGGATSGSARLSTEATGGLMANVTIINVNEASAWGVPAEVVMYDDEYASRYWSQTSSSYKGNASDLASITLDYIFIGGDVVPAQYDFPDLSTPLYYGVYNTYTDSIPVEQYESVNEEIESASGFANEYITDDSIFAETDWVLTMPTRRYAVEGRDFDKDYSTVETTGAGVDGILYPFSEVVNGDGCIDVAEFKFFDREENTTSVGVVISPGEVTTLELCGEVAVVSFNRDGATTSGALGAELTLNDATLPYADGWAYINFAAPMPIIPYAYVKANNGGSGASNMNFGAAWRHRNLYSSF